MALKKCPECKKKISDTCDTCIHCGYRLKPQVGDDYYRYENTPWPAEDKPITKVLKIIGIIFGSLLAIAAVVLLIYTFLNYNQLGFTKSAIMEAAAVVSLLGGFTMAVLCHRLL